MIQGTREDGVTKIGVSPAVTIGLLAAATYTMIHSYTFSSVFAETPGQMALETLAGRKPAEIPIVTAPEGHSIVNVSTARRLGVGISDRTLSTTQLVVGGLAK
jgi:hypothetical protein